jgi:hypothetical protein
VLLWSIHGAKGSLDWELLQRNTDRRGLLQDGVCCVTLSSAASVRSVAVWLPCHVLFSFRTMATTGWCLLLLMAVLASFPDSMLSLISTTTVVLFAWRTSVLVIRRDLLEHGCG